MTTQAHRYALRALCAQGTASALADEIQGIRDYNMAIANAQTIEQGKTLILQALATLPQPLRPVLDDNELTTLIHNLL
jgi:hypothetical protein